MRIERLVAHAFRNLSGIEIAPQAQTIVLTGNNGQGKTNILEALYVCATGRSFRHATNRQMLQHKRERASLRAVFERAEVRHEVAVTIGPHQRRIRIDGRAIRQSIHLLQLLNIVAFFPEDLAVAKGAPETRRRFFDRAVANSQPAFAQAAVDYQRALQHRNSLLRQASPPDRGLLAIYEAQMVGLAGTIHACRCQTLTELLPVAQEHFAALMFSRSLHVALRSGVAAVDADAKTDFTQAFAQALKQSYGRDRARGSTSQGPHRADLLCSLGGYDARIYASQGQQRSLVLALKLAEVVCLRKKCGFAPILLMDDVSSELDAQRSALMFDVVQAHAGQIWITATGRLPQQLQERTQIINVRDGLLA